MQAVAAAAAKVAVAEAVLASEVEVTYAPNANTPLSPPTTVITTTI